MKLLLGALVSILVGVVAGDFELRVRVHSYTNPDSRCAQCTASLINPDYRCCDNMANPGVCVGEELCDTFFQYCLRPLGSTGVRCPGDNIFGTPTRFFSADTDVLVDVGDTVFGSANPFVLTGSVWLGTQFYLQSKDSDLDESRDAVLIDSFSVDLTLPPGNSLDPAVYEGRFQLAQIELSFEVVCIGNFTTPNCTDCVAGSSEICRQPGAGADPGASRALIGGIIGGLIAVLLPVLLIAVLVTVIVIIRRSGGNKKDLDSGLPSGPLKYGQTAPITLSTDNPTYSTIADKPTNYQNSTSISMSDTYSAITVETSCELNEGQEREFDNPLYGADARIYYTDVSPHYEECQSEVQPEPQDRASDS